MVMGSNVPSWKEIFDIAARKTERIIKKTDVLLRDPLMDKTTERSILKMQDEVKTVGDLVKSSVEMCLSDGIESYYIPVLSETVSDAIHNRKPTGKLDSPLNTEYSLSEANCRQLSYIANQIENTISQMCWTLSFIQAKCIKADCDWEQVKSDKVLLLRDQAEKLKELQSCYL